MIRSLDIMNDHYRRRIGRDRVEFAPGLNVLLGPNGAGKSSVIQAVQHTSGANASRRLNDALVRIDADRSAVYFHTSSDVKNEGSPATAVDAHRLLSSRGQGLRVYLRAMDKLDREPHAVVFFDEPEISLDIDERLALVERLRHAAERHQLIVATHCPLIAMMPEGFHVVLGGDPGYAPRMIGRWMEAMGVHAAPTPRR